MTQDEFKLYTGQSVDYTPTEWAKLVAIAESRLASFLCLSNGFPQSPADDLKMLLANFMASMLKNLGSSEKVESKHVRNFTINFKTASDNAFADIAEQYGDLIDMYSNCGTGFAVERNAIYGCKCEGGFGCD